MCVVRFEVPAHAFFIRVAKNRLRLRERPCLSGPDYSDRVNVLDDPHGDDYGGPDRTHYEREGPAQQ